MRISSIPAGSRTAARSSAAAIAVAPSCTAGTSASAPPIRPIGVRAAPRITTSSTGGILPPYIKAILALCAIGSSAPTVRAGAPVGRRGKPAPPPAFVAPCRFVSDTAVTFLDWFTQPISRRRQSRLSNDGCRRSAALSGQAPTLTGEQRRLQVELEPNAPERRQGGWQRVEGTHWLTGSVRSRSFRSHEKRGAGLRQGVGLGVPTPVLRTVSRHRAFPTLRSRLPGANASRRRAVHEQLRPTPDPQPLASCRPLFHGRLTDG